MDSYIVHIYRRAGRRSHILIGTTEAAGTGRKMGFTNLDERERSSDAGTPRVVTPFRSAMPDTEGGDARDRRGSPGGIHGESASRQNRSDGPGREVVQR